MISRFENYLFSFLIGLLIGFVCGLSISSGGFDRLTGKKADTADTVYDTATSKEQLSLRFQFDSLKADTVTEPVYITKEVEASFDTSAFMESLDTSRLVADYFRERHYAKEYQDSTSTVYIKAVVRRNRLDSLGIEVDHSFESTTVTKQVQVPLSKFGLMAIGGYNTFSLHGVYHSDQWLLAPGYDLGAEGLKGFRLGVVKMF